jgi:hypothetical protein
MNLTEARDNFARATEHCENLIAVHRGYGGDAAGRRIKEVSVNRAVVVLAVASWQAVMQDYVHAVLDLSRPSAGSTAITSATYSVIAGRAQTEVQAFATPNAQNCRRLLQGVGFDPRPHWTWRQRGGRGVGMVTVTPHDADTRIDEWLKVRHAIAHGHDELPTVQALQAVRLASGPPPSDPTIRLVDAEQCVTFFRRLAVITGAAIADHLGIPAP